MTDLKTDYLEQLRNDKSLEELAPYFFDLSIEEKRGLVFNANEHVLDYSGSVDGVISAYSVRILQGLVLLQEYSRGQESEIKSFKELRSWCDYQKIKKNYLDNKFPNAAKSYFIDTFDLNAQFNFFEGELNKQQEESNARESIRLRQHTQMNALILKNTLKRIDALEVLLTPQREKYLMNLQLVSAQNNHSTLKI